MVVFLFEIAEVKFRVLVIDLVKHKNKIPFNQANSLNMLAGLDSQYYKDQFMDENPHVADGLAASPTPVQSQEPGAQGQSIPGEQYQENGVNSQIADEASLEGRVPSSEEMMEEGRDSDDLQNKIRKYIQKTELLHADEQFLKEELKVRERETLDTYAVLMAKKKELLQLVMESYNQSEALVDIGLSEELNELKKIIEGQNAKIEHLKGQISKQGLAGVLTDDKEFKIKAKAEEMEKEIKVGRKFSSTQYVRDYLERPQAYKVSYEESKYEYELRVRLKECLEMQKKVYEKKKEEMNQLKRREREREQELLKEKDFWSK